MKQLLWVLISCNGLMQDCTSVPRCLILVQVELALEQVQPDDAKVLLHVLPVQLEAGLTGLGVVAQEAARNLVLGACHTAVFISYQLSNYILNSQREMLTLIILPGINVR